MAADRLTPVVCRLADWHDDADREKLRAIRDQVFVVEQQVPVELEWDEHDATAVHFLAEHDGSAIATARLIIDNPQYAQIGRMAVITGYRSQGVGARLLKYVLDYCEQHALTRQSLHAQVQAIAFYQRFGFEATGEIFDEAGIAHRAMSRICAKKGV